MSVNPSVELIYKDKDGIKISTDVYLPTPRSSAATSAKYPVIINIHGGAFMLGHSSMVNKDQIEDCLSRGWIVLVPNHRLCPQVNILEGPMEDMRDLLAWIQDGSFDKELTATNRSDNYQTDIDRIMVMGTSSGGHLSLALGYDVPKPVAAILDFYGPANFSDDFWTQKIPHLKKPLPADLSEDFINLVYREDPIPTFGGVSLEGQAKGPPDFRKNFRLAFTLTTLAEGRLLGVCYPGQKDFRKIDAYENISKDFPPTYIVHGDADTSIPIYLNRKLLKRLQEESVECGMCEIPGEEHTFSMGMEKDSETYRLQRQGFDWLEKIINR